MPNTNFQDLLDAGCHFGHLKRKWNPKMAPYIFMEKNGIHIIDLHKTALKIDEASNVMKQLARAGRKVLFVATKKQAKDIVALKSKEVNMPYVTERWPGGMQKMPKLLHNQLQKVHVPWRKQLQAYTELQVQHKCYIQAQSMPLIQQKMVVRLLFKQKIKWKLLMLQQNL